jgi:hypothetical protein
MSNAAKLDRLPARMFRDPLRQHERFCSCVALLAFGIATARAMGSLGCGIGCRPIIFVMSLLLEYDGRGRRIPSRSFSGAFP